MGLRDCTILVDSHTKFEKFTGLQFLRSCDTLAVMSVVRPSVCFRVDATIYGQTRNLKFINKNKWQSIIVHGKTTGFQVFFGSSLQVHMKPL